MTGLDPSEAAIAHARRRAPERSYTAGVAQDLSAFLTAHSKW